MASPGVKPWPPIAAALVSAVLVFFVLPNPLRIPQNNPAAQAEYAPVPGDEDKNNEQTNFGNTGLGTSSGVGSGGLGEGAAPTIPPPPLPPQYVPRQKPCVGNPPRQTEDPLSPPCVAYFDGDNKGSTFNGVTKDEIKVVLYNDLGVTGDMTTPWQPSDEPPGHESEYEQTYLRRTIKAQLRYFQQRFQTYGRRVHVIAQRSNGLATPCSQRRGDAAKTRIDVNPFAAVHLGDGGQCYMEALAQDYRIPSFGLNNDVKRARYENFRPYIWGFFPDQESEAAWSASFICRKLKGGTAKFVTQTSSVRGKPRKFGLLYPESSGRGPESKELAILLQKYTQQECGLTWADVTAFTGDGGGQAAGLMRRYKDEDITTVVCYCVPVATENTVTKMRQAATAVDYYPEWYWDHASRMFRAIWNQTNNQPPHRSFGVNHHWRNKAFKEQYHYKAYLEQEPGTAPNTRFNFDIYHLFLNLFQAIQAAGPELTPESVETGMFSFNYTDRRNPFVPVGGYGPYNKNSIGNYTFVDTAMGWWWDPEGTPPGGEPREGCIRVMGGGRRFYPGEWPRGDNDLFVGNQPCSQDDTELRDTGASF